MQVHCENCAIRDGDKVRISYHTRIGEAIDVKLPLKGYMFGYIDKDRDIPPMFRFAEDWKEMHCLRCGKIPFQFLPDDLNRYNEQGGPDRICTDEGWLKLEKDDSSRES